MDEIGDMYDFALGYTDPTSGNTLMVGYVMPPGVGFQEATDLQDANHIVQIASPNQVDRYERYPKTSQGDWSGGSRQLIYANANQYYDTPQGLIETVQPGALQLMVQPAVTLVDAASGNPTNCSIVGMSNYVLVASYVAAGHNVTDSTGTTAQIGGDHEIIDMLPYSPSGANGGVFCAVTTAGIWRISKATIGGALSGTQQTNDAPATSGKCLAYFNDKLYYITSAGAINYTTLDAGATGGTAFHTPGNIESKVSCLCSGASGLVFSKNSPGAGRNAPTFSAIYTSDGTTAGTVRVADIPGSVNYMMEANGITYIVAQLPAVSPAGATPTGVPYPSYTLYALSGSTLTVIDDARWLPSDFTTVSYTSKASLATDGRFLYLGWGYFVIRYDLQNNYAVTRVFSFNANTGWNCISVTTGNFGGIGSAGVWAAVGQAGGGINLQQILPPNSVPSAATTANLITSYFDFGTPTTNKAFRSIDMTFQSAYQAGQVQIAYALDNATSYTPMTIQAGVSPNKIIAYFPPGTKGFRVRFQITMNSTLTASPVIVAYAVKANLGRVWTVSANCARDQKGRNGEKDIQNLSAMDMIANMVNSYKITAGQCILYIPDPTQPPVYSGGVLTNPQGVAQVNALVQDYAYTTNPGVAPGLRDSQVDGGTQRDMEGTVQLTLVEQL